MGNVIDYLIQYGDQAFAERAFCDVDVLILAQLSYFDFGSAVPTIAQHKKSVTLEEIDRTADLSAVFADKWYGENNRKLWNALLAGRRFHDALQLLSGADGGRAGGAVRSGHFFPGRL